MTTKLLLIRMLRKDKEEVEAIKHAKALEAEKAMYSVRGQPSFIISVLRGCPERVYSALMFAGPALSPTTERIPREAFKRETDQPAKVRRHSSAAPAARFEPHKLLSQELKGSFCCRYWGFSHY